MVLIFCLYWFHGPRLIRSVEQAVSTLKIVSPTSGMIGYWSVRVSEAARGCAVQLYVLLEILYYLKFAISLESNNALCHTFPMHKAYHVFLLSLKRMNETKSLCRTIKSPVSLWFCGHDFKVVYLKLIVTAISFLSTGFGEHVLHPQDTEKYTTVWLSW